MSTLLEYLDRAGVQTLSKDLLSKVNLRITERMVTDVDANQTSDLKVPTAKAVYTAIQSGIAGITQLEFQVVEGKGDMSTLVSQPKTNVMYLQRDDEADKTWVLYIYRDSKWIAIGDTSIDLVDYWAKKDITELKTALGLVTLEATVSQLSDDFDEYKESFTKLSDSDISEIVNSAFSQTAPSLEAAE